MFTARPGRIKTIVAVTFERPRDSRDPACHALHASLAQLFSDEVDPAFVKQEASGA